MSAMPVPLDCCALPAWQLVAAGTSLLRMIVGHAKWKPQKQMNLQTLQSRQSHELGYEENVGNKRNNAKHQITYTP